VGAMADDLATVIKGGGLQGSPLFLFDLMERNFFQLRSYKNSTLH